MNETRTCPRCGAQLSERRAEGLCLACLAKLSLQIPPAQAQAIGDYELLEEINRGGMGVVYKARQRSLGRTVALKMILSGHFARPEEVQRFKAEAQAAANLQHPNIVAIHEVGQWEGHHFFSMDYVHGPALAELVRAQPLMADQAARYVRIIAQAVQYAHERGVLHRDLKPSNVLIDDQDQPRITDFGLAKLANVDSDLTLSGKAIGSPNYMPPEQSVGQRSAIGPHSDIYSMGAMLYHLLTGRPPFSAETVQATLTQVLHHEPVAPRALNPTVPRDLETICLKCLEKDPHRRYATARELAEELELFLTRRPILARPVSPAGRTWRWCRRNPVLASWIFVAMTVLLLGFAGVLWQWQRAEHHARSESTERNRAERTLTQLELQRVEDLLRENESAKALAHLAFSLRKDPANLAVAERLLSLLTHRNFALPLTPPMHHQGRINDASLSRDGKWTGTASDDHTARIWDANTGQPVTTIRHGDPVQNINFSPDSRWFATASASTARVWDLITGQPITPPLVHTGAVTFAFFSPDGQSLITGTDDRCAQLWTLPGGEARFLLPYRSNTIWPKFAPTGNLLFTTAPGGLANVWNYNTGQLLHTLNMEGRILDASASYDGQRLALASDNGFVKIWDLQNGSLIVSLPHQSPVMSIEFSPDSEILATATRDRRVLLWDGRTGQLAMQLPEHLTQIKHIEFSPDGLRLVTLELSNRILIWDILTGQLACEPIQLPGRVRIATIDPTGEHLMTLADNTPLQIWDIRPGAALPLILFHRADLSDVQFTTDGHTALTASQSGTASLWETATARRTLRVQHGSPVLAAQLSPDRRTLVTSGADAKTRLWDTTSGQTRATISHPATLTSLRFSPDGTWFITACRDGTARTWLTQTGQPLAPQPMRHPRLLWHADVSPNGQLVVTASDDRTARIWDPRTAKPISPPLTHLRAGVFHAAFSPDSRTLITTSLDMTARLWDVTTGQQLFLLLHNAPVRSAQFSPDGTRILTAADDNTARLWDPRTGLPLTEPLRHNGPVRYAEFSFDGRRILTASLDGTTRLWDTLIGSPVTEPLLHPQPVPRARISPNTQWLLSAVRDGYLWEHPVVHTPAPDWLIQLSEAVGGIRLGKNNLEELVHHHQLFQIKAALNPQPSTQNQNPDYYTRWAHWFFADRLNRNLSPSALLKPHIMRSNFSHEDTFPGVRQHLALSPTNAQAWARLAQLTHAQQQFQNPYKNIQAQIFSRRATHLDPTEPTAWAARVEILSQSSDLNTAMRELDNAANHLPQPPQLWNIKGDLLKKHGHLPEASHAYLTAIQSSRAAKATLINAIHTLGDLLWSTHSPFPPAQAQAIWDAALELPARHAQLPTNSLDLSRYYNASLVDSFQNRKFPANNLNRLPRGSQHLAGIQFDVRGVIQLAGKSLDTLESGYPVQVRDIKPPHPLPCTRLHFLHATAFGYNSTDKINFTGAGNTIGKYIIHYVDRSETEIPLVTAKNIDEWWVGTWSRQLTDARVAWEGENENGDPVRLCVYTWTNPKPETPIASIDFCSDMTMSGPFVIAITAE